MSEQNADARHDTSARGQRGSVGIGFWVATGGVALAVIVPFLADPAGAWDFWVRVSEMSATHCWLYS